MSVSFSSAVAVWAKIGLLSFGGPAAQIALMHREIVEERKWLSESKFLNALNFCMLLPGPEAMQLATYAGWRLHGVLGGLAAGLLFVGPGAAVILALAIIYAYFGSVPIVEAVFYGVKAAVLIIVVEALWKVAKRALQNRAHWILAGLAFLALFVLQVPYPIVVLGAGAYGFWATHNLEAGPAPPRVSLVRTLSTLATFMTAWFAPLLLLSISGPTILSDIFVFFSKLAVVTFGGAYAVLAYMSQTVVVDFGWLEPGEMLDGLGLAETTPGPLILVTEFVGFLAGFRDGGLVLGVLAALVTLWVTFVPCFLWIFVGGPYLDWISSQPRLTGAMAAITAAVVGVILNLSLWFAIHVLFAEVWEFQFGFMKANLPNLLSLNFGVSIVAILSAILIFRYHWSIVRVLFVAAIAGPLLSVFQLT